MTSAPESMVPYLQVRNLRKSLEFYTSVLGFEVTEVLEQDDIPFWAALRHGDIKIMLSSRPVHDRRELRWLHVDNVDSWHASVQDACAHDIMSPADQQHGLREFLISDPDGYVFVIAEPLNKNARGARPRHIQNRQEDKMADHFEKVKDFLLDMNLTIVHEDEGEELVVVENQDDGIQRLIIDCEAPIVVLEQYIMDVPDDDEDDFYRRLLQINRTLIHGAFVLDDNAKRVFWRDTLQLRNLDFNELEASINSLSFALGENASELLDFAKS